MTKQDETRKEDLTLFVKLFLKYNLKPGYGFAKDTIDEFVDKYIDATTKVKMNAFNKLLTKFENSIYDLNGGATIESERWAIEYRPHRVSQFLLCQDELINAIKEREDWLIKKKMGVKNYISK